MPRAADFSAPEYWAGLRPMTPTGLPIIGRSKWDNLWLNTGHGHMGWTMSRVGTIACRSDCRSTHRNSDGRDGTKQYGTTLMEPQASHQQDFINLKNLPFTVDDGIAARANRRRCSRYRSQY